MVYRIFLCTLILLFAHVLKAQEFYEFGEKNPTKGKFAITPIVGVQIQKLEDFLPAGAAKLEYFFSEYITAGVQYLYLKPSQYLRGNYLYDYGSPQHSVLAIAGGHYFPANGKLGLHTDAGMGYIISGAKNFTYYFDIGLGVKLTPFSTIQLQFMTVNAASAGGLGLQIKI